MECKDFRQIEQKNTPPSVKSENFHQEKLKSAKFHFDVKSASIPVSDQRALFEMAPRRPMGTAVPALVPRKCPTCEHSLTRCETGIRWRMPDSDMLDMSEMLRADCRSGHAGLPVPDPQRVHVPHAESTGLRSCQPGWPVPVLRLLVHGSDLDGHRCARGRGSRPTGAPPNERKRGQE